MSARSAAPDAPRWAIPASLLLCVLGLADAAYLTYEHYTGSTTLACSDQGLVNCAAVTKSQYAVVAGLPVALLGLLFFVAMLLLCLPPLWRNDKLGVVRLVGVVVGVLMVLYLVYVELIELDRLCLWCTGVHVVTVALFVVVASAEALRRP